jgi:hypothetical protein
MRLIIIKKVRESCVCKNSYLGSVGLSRMFFTNVRRSFSALPPSLFVRYLCVQRNLKKNSKILKKKIKINDKIVIEKKFDWKKSETL